jgi:phage FluMu protein Com
MLQFRCGKCKKRFADVDIIDGIIVIKGTHYNLGRKCDEVNEITFENGEVVRHEHYSPKEDNIPEGPEVTE